MFPVEPDYSATPELSSNLVLHFHKVGVNFKTQMIKFDAAETKTSSVVVPGIIQDTKTLDPTISMRN